MNDMYHVEHDGNITAFDTYAGAKCYIDRLKALSMTTQEPVIITQQAPKRTPPMAPPSDRVFYKQYIPVKIKSPFPNTSKKKKDFFEEDLFEL